MPDIGVGTWFVLTLLLNFGLYYCGLLNYFDQESGGKAPFGSHLMTLGLQYSGQKATHLQVILWRAMWLIWELTWKTQRISDFLKKLRGCEPCFTLLYSIMNAMR